MVLTRSYAIGSNHDRLQTVLLAPEAPRPQHQSSMLHLTSPSSQTLERNHTASSIHILDIISSLMEHKLRPWIHTSLRHIDYTPCSAVSNSPIISQHSERALTLCKHPNRADLGTSPDIQYPSSVGQGNSLRLDNYIGMSITQTTEAVTDLNDLKYTD